jgi:hypothetical protein
MYKTGRFASGNHDDWHGPGQRRWASAMRRVLGAACASAVACMKTGEKGASHAIIILGPVVPVYFANHLRALTKDVKQRILEVITKFVRDGSATTCVQ